MLTNATIDKLIEMKLTAMADALRIQLDDPKMNEVNFEDRFSHRILEAQGQQTEATDQES